MIYVRGAPADYDHWAYLGNVGWDLASVLPYFKKSEDYYGGASHYHGVGGPLAVSRIIHPNPLTEAFIDGALAAAMRSITTSPARSDRRRLDRPDRARRSPLQRRGGVPHARAQSR